MGERWQDPGDEWWCDWCGSEIVSLRSRRRTEERVFCDDGCLRSYIRREDPPKVVALHPGSGNLSVPDS